LGRLSCQAHRFGLRCEYLTVTNTLSHYTKIVNSTVKCFLKQASEYSPSRFFKDFLWQILTKSVIWGQYYKTFFLSSLQILAKCENIRQKTTLPHCNSVILSTVKKLYCIEPKVPMKNRIYLWKADVLMYSLFSRIAQISH